MQILLPLILIHTGLDAMYNIIRKAEAVKVDEILLLAITWASNKQGTLKIQLTSLKDSALNSSSKSFLNPFNMNSENLFMSTVGGVDGCYKNQLK